MKKVGFTIGMLGYTRQLAENELQHASKSDRKSIQDFLDKLEDIFQYIELIKERRSNHLFKWDELLLTPPGIRKSSAVNTGFLYKVGIRDVDGMQQGYSYFSRMEDANEYSRGMKDEGKMVDLQKIDLKDNIVSILNIHGSHPDNG